MRTRIDVRAMTCEPFNGRARPLLALLLLASPLAAQIADGDRHYAARGDGAAGRRARSEQIDAAIAAYRQAIAQKPVDLEAHWKLLRAYRFKGAYVAATSDQKKQVYGEAREAGVLALAAVARQLAARGISNPAQATEAEVAAVVRTIPGGAEIHLWDAINWGEWALVHGKLAAARQGVADRIRRQATIAHLANPALDGGGPARVLGRLHDQTPRIPFLTGWASANDAVKFLEQALAFDPSSKLTLVFLAEALVSKSASNRARAVQLLERVTGTPGHPDLVVEDNAAVEDAFALLRKWKG